MQKGYVGKRIPQALFIYFHHESEGTVSTIANQNTQQLHERILTKNKLVETPKLYTPLSGSKSNNNFNIFD